jgi:hypothetical protein
MNEQGCAAIKGIRYECASIDDFKYFACGVIRNSLRAVFATNCEESFFSL